MAGRSGVYWGSLLLCMLLGACSLHHVAAQTSVQQGQALQKIADYLSKSVPPIGWDPAADPCTYPGVACTAGSVTAINLANRPLTGSLPDEPGVWSNLPDLTSIDFSNTGLGGAIPASLVDAPKLTTINLGGNTLTGSIPALTALQSNPGFSLVLRPGNSQLEGAIPAPTPPAEAPVASPDVPAAPVDTPTPVSSPVAPVPTPTPTTTPAPTTPATVPAAAPSPSPAPVPIANAPICSCALKGFGSTECQSAFASQCAGSSPPPSAACDGYKTATSDLTAANAVGQYLQGQCFGGQDMTASACSCTTNLGSNDCAKARVGLCAKSDVLCLPYQNFADGASAAQIAAYLTQNCPIPTASKPGVQVTISFASIDLNTYVNQQYTQGVANALSSVGNVPSSAVSVLDVRPLAGSRRRRALLQGNSAGVQATYFVASDQPEALSTALQRAASDNSLATALNNNGISGSPAVTLQTFTAPVAPTPAPAAASDGGSSFPAWAIAVIVVGVVLLLALTAAICCCRIRRRRAHNKQHHVEDDRFAPSPSKPVAYDAPMYKSEVQMGPGSNDLAVSRSVRTTPASAPYLAGSPASSFNASPAPAAAASTGKLPTPWDAPAPVRTTVPLGAAAGGAALGAGLGAGAVAASHMHSQPAVAASDGSEWRTNVRSTGSETGAAALAGAPTAAGASSSMAANPARSLQQAERAKFWAQFQETWQQVRQTKKVKEDEPGTPSSGTNWTDTDAGSDHGRGRQSMA